MRNRQRELYRTGSGVYVGDHRGIATTQYQRAIFSQTLCAWQRHRRCIVDRQYRDKECGGGDVATIGDRQRDGDRAALCAAVGIGHRRQADGTVSASSTDGDITVGYQRGIVRCCRDHQAAGSGLRVADGECNRTQHRVFVDGLADYAADRRRIPRLVVFIGADIRPATRVDDTALVHGERGYRIRCIQRGVRAADSVGAREAAVVGQRRQGNRHIGQVAGTGKTERVVAAEVVTQRDQQAI